MNIIRLDEVDSTNLYAKSNIDKFADRSVIIAKRQTNGRGRFSRTWVDLGDNNIFMSIVLKPSNSFSETYTNLTQYMSVALCKVFEDYGLSPSIKWPNDVLICGKKIAGILSETVMNGINFKGLVLGVGINLNSDEQAVKSIKDREVTALNIELGKNINCENFLEELLDEFFKSYDEFLSKGFSLIYDDYVERCSIINEEISIRIFNELKSGIAKYISKKGELILENNKEEMTLTMGDIL